MRTVQTVGFLRIACVTLLVACASGKTMPAEQDVDAAQQKDGPVEQPTDAQMHDAAVAMPDASPDAFVCTPVATEHLTNPVFDLAPDGVNWVAVRNPALYPIISANPTGVTPISAPNKAWFGGASGDDLGMTSVTDSLHQDVTFPAGATTFVVSGYYLIGGIDVTTTVYDTFTLDVIQTNGTPIENVVTYNNTQNTSATTFAPFTKTLTSNLAGQTVRLRATSTNDIIYHTNFFIDSLSFKATHCP